MSGGGDELIDRIGRAKKSQELTLLFVCLFLFVFAANNQRHWGLSNEQCIFMRE